jgi:hypothetical protein
MRHSRWSRKPLGGLLPHESLPATPLPFLAGKEGLTIDKCGRISHRGSSDCCFSVFLYSYSTIFFLRSLIYPILLVCLANAQVQGQLSVESGPCTEYANDSDIIVRDDDDCSWQGNLGYGLHIRINTTRKEEHVAALVAAFQSCPKKHYTRNKVRDGISVGSWVELWQ